MSISPVFDWIHPLSTSINNLDISSPVSCPSASLWSTGSNGIHETGQAVWMECNPKPLSHSEWQPRLQLNHAWDLQQHPTALSGTQYKVIFNLLRTQMAFSASTVCMRRFLHLCVYNEGEGRGREGTFKFIRHLTINQTIVLVLKIWYLSSHSSEPDPNDTLPILEGKKYVLWLGYMTLGNVFLSIPNKIFSAREHLLRLLNYISAHFKAMSLNASWLTWWVRVECANYPVNELFLPSWWAWCLCCFFIRTQWLNCRYSGVIFTLLCPLQ